MYFYNKRDHFLMNLICSPLTATPKQQEQEDFFLLANQRFHWAPDSYHVLRRAVLVQLPLIANACKAVDGLRRGDVDEGHIWVVGYLGDERVLPVDGVALSRSHR
jgi:hypothetical protein